MQGRSRRSDSSQVWRVVWSRWELCVAVRWLHPRFGRFGLKIIQDVVLKIVRYGLEGWLLVLFVWLVLIGDLID